VNVLKPHLQTTIWTLLRAGNSQREIERRTGNIVDTEIVKAVSKSGQVLRWAILTTRNGFAVTSRPSVAVSPENDSAEIGESVAIDNATDELWPLMGYALKEKHAATPADFRDRVRLEKTQIDEKREALAAFLGTPTGLGLPSTEQHRLRDQLDAMRDYSAILGERISAFQG
jgi:hypothetical protein